MKSPSFRARWGVGIKLLFVAGWSLGLVFNLFRFTMDRIAPDALELSPPAMAVLVSAVFLLLGPFLFAAIIQFASLNGEGAAQIYAFWWRGMRIGIAFLITILPVFIVRASNRYLFESGAIDASSHLAFSLFILSLCLIVFPLWVWMVWRLLPRTSVGRRLIEPIRQAGLGPAD